MKISIPEPCSEDWSKMTPTEQGAFCKKCALEVTDFTEKSALEIKEILTTKIQSKQRVCGHIENRQLIEFNNEFIPWKSEQESFRAIWAFSLIAVFGLTLFSCQSTFSKEVVEKMKTSTEQMLEEEKDTLDIAKLNDSIKVMNQKDSLATNKNPWAIVPHLPYQITGLPAITDGGIGWEIEPFVVDICTVLNGDLATLGFMYIEPIIDDEELKPTNQARMLTNPLDYEALPPNKQLPKDNERNHNNNQRLNAKLEKGRPDFKAYISPVPIDKTSKLFVTIPAEGELKLSIWEVSSIVKVHSECFDMVFGNHAVHINFHDFPKGKYAIQLIWEDEKVVVPFEIPPQKVS